MEIDEKVAPNFATVLVAEANPGDAMALRRMLGVYGLRTIVLVDSAERALAFLERESCDLILTEYPLKKMNGVRLIDQVHHAYPETPVIMVSGVNDERLIAAAISAGAADFIAKDALLQVHLFRAIKAALAPKAPVQATKPEHADADPGPTATTHANIDANWLVDPFVEGTHLDAFDRSSLLAHTLDDAGWAAATDSFANYIRACVDPLASGVRAREEVLVRMFIDSGFGPQEILTAFRGAVRELTVDPLFINVKPRVSLSAVLARVLCRWGQDYQWQLWLQINEPAA
jgi:DNA-binding NarL/FixJ family response regulator